MRSARVIMVHGVIAVSLLTASALARPPTRLDPTVRLSSLTLDPPQPAVEGVDEHALRRQLGSLLACYRESLRRHGRFEAQLTLELRIDPAGSATVQAWPIPDRNSPSWLGPTRTCVVHAVKRVRFGRGESRVARLVASLIPADLPRRGPRKDRVVQ